MITTKLYGVRIDIHEAPPCAKGFTRHIWTDVTVENMSNGLVEHSFCDYCGLERQRWVGFHANSYYIRKILYIDHPVQEKEQP